MEFPCACHLTKSIHKTLRNSVQQQNDYSQNSLKALSDLEKYIFSFRRLQRQTNTTSFFDLKMFNINIVVSELQLGIFKIYLMLFF